MKILSIYILLLFTSIAFSQVKIKSIDLIPNREVSYVENILNGATLNGFKNELTSNTTCLTQQHFDYKTVLFSGTISKFSELTISVNQNSKTKSLKIFAYLVNKNESNVLKPKNIIECKLSKNGESLLLKPNKEDYKIVVGVFDNKKLSNANFTITFKMKTI